jgi:hypothetical protein
MSPDKVLASITLKRGTYNLHIQLAMYPCEMAKTSCCDGC